MRNWVILVIVAISFACSGVRPLPSQLSRNDDSFPQDLMQLHDYVGDMPVDLVVEGYAVPASANLTISKALDSNETIIMNAVIVRLSPGTTVVRSRDASAKFLEIPTSQVRRITAEGIRRPFAQQETKVSPWWWMLLPSGLLVWLTLKLLSTNAFAGDSLDGCVYMIFALLVLGAAVVMLLFLLAGSSASSQDSSQYQLISNTWTFQ